MISIFLVLWNSHRLVMRYKKEKIKVARKKCLKRREVILVLGKSKYNYEWMTLMTLLKIIAKSITLAVVKSSNSLVANTNNQIVKSLPHSMTVNYKVFKYSFIIIHIY